MNEQSFGNLDQIESQSYSLVPPGVYTLRAVDINLVDTKGGAGKAFKVQFSIVGGEYDDRKIFEMFNVINANNQAVEIALSSIKSWIESTGGQASGQLTASMVLELEGKTFSAKVGVSKAKNDEYDDQNTIKRFLPADGQSSEAGMSTEPVSSGPKKKAWEK